MFIFVMAIYLLLLAEDAEGSFECEVVSRRGLSYGNCSCHSSDPNLLYCPSIITDNETVTVQVKGTSLKVDCENEVGRESLLNLLVSLNISDSYSSSLIRNAHFTNCPPTRIPLSLLLDTIGLKHIRKLSINCKKGGNSMCHEFINILSTQLTNMTNIEMLQFQGFTQPVTLDRRSLEGVPNLLSLTMQNIYSVFKLDPETFHVIPRLKHLTVLRCNLRHLHRDAFKNLTSLTLLNLGDNAISTLPSQLFADLKMLEKLLLHENLLSSIPSGVFDNMEYLRFLKINKNKLVSLPGELFSKNKKLTRFILRDNIGEVELDPHLFKNSHLKSIELYHVQVGSIPEGLLDGNLNLQKFIVQSATLQNLPNALFRDTKNIIKIDFSNNSLTQINPQLLKHLDKLQELKIRKNEITQLDSQTFRGLTSLKTVKLDDNQISHIEAHTFKSQSSSLSLLHLQQNKLTTVTFTTNLHNLRAIDLSYNLLDSVQRDLGSGKPYLVHINLAGNNIGPVIELEDVTFQEVIGEVQLNLSENKIQQIFILEQLSERNNTKTTSQNGPKTRVRVTIDDNPIICDCLLTKLKGNKQDPGEENVRINWGRLFCGNESASSLIDQNVDLLNPHDLNCKFPSTLFPTNCPPPCQCFLNRFQKQIFVNCANNKLTKIPTNLPFISHEADSIHLNLRNNSLTDLRQLTAVSNLEKISHLNLSHNNLFSLESYLLPPHLTQLDFSHNSIEILSNSTLSTLSKLTLLSLSHNPYKCSCDLLNLYNFLLSHRRQVQDFSQVHSQCRPNLPHVQVELLHGYCANPPTIIIASASIVSFLVILLTVIFVVILSCFKEKILIWLYSKTWAERLFVEDVREKEKPYDAFLSYSPLDTEFVEGVLLPGLETPPKNCKTFKCCVHSRDGEIGSIIPEQITASLESSRRTLVVLTRNYVASQWARHEFRAAHSQTLKEEEGRLIVIKHGDLPSTDDMEEDLRKYLKLTTYLDAADPWFWHKLRYALPHRRRSGGGRRKRRETGKVELISANSWETRNGANSWETRNVNKV